MDGRVGSPALIVGSGDATACELAHKADKGTLEEGSAQPWIQAVTTTPCALFKLFYCTLVRVKPMVVSQMVPDSTVMRALMKEERTELHGPGLLLHRGLALKYRVAVAKERVQV